MTKTEQLIIRACKAKNPELRLQNVIRRAYFNLKTREAQENQTLQILIPIVDGYQLVSVAKALNAAQPNLFENLSHTQRVIDFCIRAIRFAETSKFNGELSTPRRFR